VSVLPAAHDQVPVEREHLAQVIQLVPQHEHTWALRETEYDDSGITLNRFECDGCPAVRFT